MIDQINELPDGLKSSPETSRFTENKWISRKNQNKLYFLHLILKENYQKNVKKNQLYFFFQTQSLLMNKVIKNKRDLKLVASRSIGYETSSEKFFYWLYII